MWLPRVRTLHIGLSAQRLVFAEVGGAWPGKVSACHSSDYAEEMHAEPWRPAVAELARLLAKKGGNQPTLRIVLSGRFVRWQLLPWRPEITQPKEVAAYASLRFRETFGKAAEDWQVLHAPQPPGKTVPACAVDAALLETLRSTCAGAGAHLAAVTPYFASAFDRWRGVFEGKTAWFGLIETDYLSLALLRNGDWISLCTQHLDGDWRDVLPGMMAQIGIPAGLGGAEVPLYLAGSGEPAAPAESLPFAWLRPEAQVEGGMVGCRMALGV